MREKFGGCYFYSSFHRDINNLVMEGLLPGEEDDIIYVFVVEYFIRVGGGR